MSYAAAVSTPTRAVTPADLRRKPLSALTNSPQLSSAGGPQRASSLNESYTIMPSSDGNIKKSVGFMEKPNHQTKGGIKR